MYNVRNKQRNLSQILIVFDNAWVSIVKLVLARVALNHYSGKFERKNNYLNFTRNPEWVYKKSKHFENENRISLEGKRGRTLF